MSRRRPRPHRIMSRLHQPLATGFVALTPAVPPTHYVRPIFRSLALAVLLASFSAGCSATDDSDDTTQQTIAVTTPPTPAVTSASPTSSDPAPTAAPTASNDGDSSSANADLEAAVHDFWKLYLDVGASTEPFDPIATRERLAARTSGEELEALFDFFQSTALAGYVVRGDIDSSLTLVSSSATEAEVRDCYDDTTGLYRIDDGERVDTDNPARHQVVFVLVNDGGTWKVESVRDEGDGCDASL